MVSNFYFLTLMDQTSETTWAKQSDYWSLSNIRGYKGPICGFEKSLKYAEILINENLSMSQQITIYNTY